MFQRNVKYAKCYSKVQKKKNHFKCKKHIIIPYIEKGSEKKKKIRKVKTKAIF